MKVFGLFGEKLSHSLSPEIHRMIFEKLNIDGTYGLFSIKRENFNNAITSIKTLGIDGVNVTIPYKEEVMKYLDNISNEAKNIGAINTVKVINEKTYGFNTDYFGFGQMIYKGNVEVKGNNFYILGGGGAAKAIIYYLKVNKANSITIVSRNIIKAKEKFKGYDVRCIDYHSLKKVKSEYCIINTTPVGMYPNIDECAVNDQILEKFKVAMDIVYNPVETLFLKNAKKLGLNTVDGIYMLVGQGIKAQEIWNDILIDKTLIDEIYDYIRNILEKKRGQL